MKCFVFLTQCVVWNNQCRIGKAQASPFQLHLLSVCLPHAAIWFSFSSHLSCLSGSCPLGQLPFNGGFPASSPSNFLLLHIGQIFVTYLSLNGKVAEKMGEECLLSLACRAPLSVD